MPLGQARPGTSTAAATQLPSSANELAIANATMGGTGAIALSPPDVDGLAPEGPAEDGAAGVTAAAAAAEAAAAGGGETEEAAGAVGAVGGLRAAELQFKTTLGWAPARRQVRRDEGASRCRVLTAWFMAMPWLLAGLWK